MSERTIHCIVLAVILLSGCRRGPEMVPVVGKIIYQGEPLAYGSVMFQPVGVEGAQTARSKIASDGSFALWTTNEGDGVVVGTSRVRVTAFEAQRANATGGKHEELALGKSAIPRRFQNFGTSGITIDVSPDMPLPLTIDLSSIK